MNTFETNLFDQWNKTKKKISLSSKTPFFNEREIWWISVGENIGDEENGKGQRFLRPILILKKFNSKLFYAIPLSSKIKSNKYYVSFSFKEQKISAIISQLRIFDGKRLQDKMGKIPNNTFKKLKNSFIELF